MSRHGKTRQAVASFKGIKTRLEYLGNFSGRLLYWDFAQHPVKISASLTALRQHYPKAKITVVFDPSSTALKYPQLLLDFGKAFVSADRIFLSRVSFLKNISAENRISGNDLIKEINKTKKSAYYQPENSVLIDNLVKNSTKEDVIIFMSSGGVKFTKLINEFGNRLSKENEQ